MMTLATKEIYASPFLLAWATVARRLRTRIGAGMMLALCVLMSGAPARANQMSAEIKLYDRVGHQVGRVKLTPHGGDVAVQVRVQDLPPGFHGFHMHAVGECIPPFISAGGHFDLGMHPHRDHAGDFPVLLVGRDGTAYARFTTDRFTVADLFDADGSAIIIHANPDNYANIPTRYAPAPDATTLATGDAGDRIACGVVEKVIER